MQKARADVGRLLSASTLSSSWKFGRRKRRRLASERTNSNSRTTIAKVLSPSEPVENTLSLQLRTDSMNGETTQATRTKAIRTWKILRFIAGNLSRSFARPWRLNPFTGELYSCFDLERSERLAAQFAFSL